MSGYKWLKREDDKWKFVDYKEYATHAIIDLNDLEWMEKSSENIFIKEKIIKEQERTINYLKSRIVKESNQDRKLKPKRNHSGYVVLSYRQTAVRDFRNKKTFHVWTTTIQTPWKSNLADFKIVKDLIERDLFSKDSKHSICTLGINFPTRHAWDNTIRENIYVEYSIAELNHTKDPKIQHYNSEPIDIPNGRYDYYNKNTGSVELFEDESNILFDIEFKNNVQSGYWEVVLTHTKELANIPEYMTPYYSKKEQDEDNSDNEIKNAVGEDSSDQDNEAYDEYETEDDEGFI